MNQNEVYQENGEMMREEDLLLIFFHGTSASLSFCEWRKGILFNKNVTTLSPTAKGEIRRENKISA